MDPIPRAPGIMRATIPEILKMGRPNPRGLPASFDDQQAETAIIDNTDNQQILTFRSPPGLKGFITNFGQAFDAALNTFVTFSLLVNGGVIFPFLNLKAQICAPEQTALVPLPRPIPIEQLSQISVIANLQGAGTGGNFTARVICKYYNPDEVFTV